MRPGLTELKSHGTNAMRDFDRVAFTTDTREATLRLLDENADDPALQAFAAARTAKAG